MYLRPAVPQPSDPHMRKFVLFGGPDDGAVIERIYPPAGYLESGGALCVWNGINSEKLWPTK